MPDTGVQFVEKLELVVLILHPFVLAKILKVCCNTLVDRGDNFFDHTGSTTARAVCAEGPFERMITKKETQYGCLYQPFL